VDHRHPADLPSTLDAPAGADCLLRAGGASLSAADRAKLLADLRAGAGPAKLTLEASVFHQTADPNRNFVRFKPSVLRRMAKTFEGMPFLRDHAQRDLLARGGTILASSYDGAEGLGTIHQTIELVKPWAIEAALDGTISTFSIGWNNTGPVVCSLCEAPYERSFFGAYPTCQHLPGDVVEAKDGAKQTAEMLVTGAEGVEVSAVSVPAVVGTGVEQIRAALAASRVRAVLAIHHEEKPMKSIATKLGLAESADEATILAAVEKIRLDAAAATALHEAEAKAHGVTRARLAEVDGELAAVRKADREKTLASLIDATERKVGKGTAVNDVVRQLADVSLEKAQAYVAQLAQVLPIGQPLISRGAEPPTAKAGTLTEQQKRICRQLGVPEAEYLKNLQDGA
jgi:hypothetical protein